MANEYSPAWFRTFLPPDAPAPEREVAFLRRHLPLDTHPFVLDLGCGPGRHANALGRAGYRVLGVDRDPGALAAAREGAPPTVRYLEMDMRELGELDEGFDACICMWQSFGYFDRATNRRVLREVRRRLRPGGRVVLDLYNAEAARGWPAAEETERDGRAVSVRRTFAGHRLQVELRYPEGGGDRFDWEVFDPRSVRELAVDCGLRVERICADFDDGVQPTPDHGRMQVVLRRPSADEAPALELAHLDRADLRERLGARRKEARRHAVWAWVGGSPWAAIPIVGFALEGAFGVVVALGTVVTVWEAYQASRAYDDVRDLEAHLETIRRELEEDH